MSSAASPPQQPPRAADICKRFELGEVARALLDAEDEPDEFLAVLMEDRLFTDAIRFTAYRLSKRQAVWWGCLVRLGGVPAEAIVAGDCGSSSVRSLGPGTE